MYGTMEDPDYKNVCFALQSLNRPYEVAQTLLRLCKGSETSSLQAFQIAFDLQEAENQGFVLKVVAHLNKLNAPAGTGTAAGGAGAEGGSGANASADGQLGSALALSVPDPMDESDPSPVGSPVFLRRQESIIVSKDVLDSRLEQLNKILTEGFDVDLILNFLCKQNQADVKILNSIKKATEGRTIVLHNATVAPCCTNTFPAAWSAPWRCTWRRWCCLSSPTSIPSCP